MIPSLFHISSLLALTVTFFSAQNRAATVELELAEEELESAMNVTKMEVEKGKNKVCEALYIIRQFNIQLIGHHFGGQQIFNTHLKTYGARIMETIIECVVD